MIFRSPYPDVAIPDAPLAAYVLRHAERLAEKPALIDASRANASPTAPWPSGYARSKSALAERGFGKGDVFGIYAPNCLDYAVAILAIAARGGIATTVNHLATADDLARQLADAGASWLLTAPDLLDHARAATASWPVREVFVLGEAAGATPFTDLVREGVPPPDVTIGADDVVLLPYSSGTTGLPKGVMITHGTWVANLCQSSVPGRVTPEDVIFCLPPFFHMYGAFILGLVLAGGGTLVLTPRFDLQSFLAAVQREKVTRAYLVPPVVLSLVNDPIVGSFDLSSLTCIISAAAPLGEDLGRRCYERLGCRVIQAYGLTETSPATHITAVTGRPANPGSVGPLVPNTECMVVDLTTGAALGRASGASSGFGDRR